MQIDVFVYMVTHIDTEEEAVRFMEQALRYMVNGWYGMFGITPDRQGIAGVSKEKK